MIVITDGESHDSPDLEKVIEDSEKDNVTRYAVAVSSGALPLQEAVRDAHGGTWLPKEVLGRGRTLRGTQMASVLTAPPALPAPIAGCQAQRGRTDLGCSGTALSTA